MSTQIKSNRICTVFLDTCADNLYIPYSTYGIVVWGYVLDTRKSVFASDGAASPSLSPTVAGSLTLSNRTGICEGSTEVFRSSRVCAAVLLVALELHSAPRLAAFLRVGDFFAGIDSNLSHRDSAVVRLLQKLSIPAFYFVAGVCFGAKDGSFFYGARM